MLNTETFQPSDIRRRQFLKVSVGALAACGVAGASPLFSETTIPQRAGAATRVIYVLMRGGMSHIDTLDPKPDRPEIQGPVKSLATRVDGILLSEYLPGLAERMHHGCLIRSMTSTAGDHQLATYSLLTSYAKRGTIEHPHIGSWVSRLCGRINPSLPAFVSIGASRDVGNGFFEAKYGSLSIGDPEHGLSHAKRLDITEAKDFDKRIDLRKWMNRRFTARHNETEVRAYEDAYEDALRLMGSRDLEAFDISKEKESVARAYGDHNFGRQCLLARRLVERGVRFVQVELGGWDTHDNNFERVQDNAAILDLGLGALIDDLHRRGLLDETLVVLASEFGRTPGIQKEKQDGRNHHPKAFSSLLVGGGIRGGTVYGSSDERGDVVVDGRVRYQDLNATIGWALGVDLEKGLTSPSGRPFTMADDGKALRSLFT